MLSVKEAMRGLNAVRRCASAGSETVRDGEEDRGERDAPGGANGEATAYQAGMATRRAVLGDAHVDRASAEQTVFDEAFQRLITESAWGSVWSRPELTKRERSLITIALMASLGHQEELAMHVRATRNTGASPEDIRETLLHVAIYAGVPAANTAIKTVKKALSEMSAVEDAGRYAAETGAAQTRLVDDEEAGDE